MNRNRSPLRYFQHHALDVAKAPLLIFALVTIGLCLVIWRWLKTELGAFGEPTAFLTGTLAVVLTVACLMASGGVAGNDVGKGYYRSWFSKPMAPWWFYLQRWLLGGLAVLCIPLMLGLGIQLLFGKGTGISGTIMAQTGMVYLLVGGCVLLASVFSARDWLITFFLTFLQNRLEDVVSLMEMTQATPPQGVIWLHKILPPFHMVSVGKPMPEGHDLSHVLLYGGSMVVIALFLFAKKPLGSGGRA